MELAPRQVEALEFREARHLAQRGIRNEARPAYVEKREVGARATYRDDALVVERSACVPTSR